MKLIDRDKLREEVARKVRGVTPKEREARHEGAKRTPHLDKMFALSKKKK